MRIGFREREKPATMDAYRWRNVIGAEAEVMSQLANDWMDLLVLLPPTDRAEIAHRLMESLAEPSDPTWEATWADELQKRVERMKSGAVQGIPFDEVMDRLRRKYA